jgi:hypothetical protein
MTVCDLRVFGAVKPLLGGVVGLAVTTFSAAAMTYTPIPVDDGSTVIAMEGRIESGDDDRLGAFVARLPRTARITGIALHSAGGNIYEAATLAARIYVSGWPTMVDGASVCASACFLLFAAGRVKVAQSDALIAVHSASSSDGEETKTALAVTTEMARVAAGLGVPLGIIGKMVTTPPDQIARLTRADLVSMGVIFADAPAPYASPAPPKSSQPTLPPTTKPYEDGFADRRAWEWWFGDLAGAFQDGAEYWAGERSNPQPGSCYGPAGQNQGDWTAGCLAAKRILAPSDIRRKAEPEYRAGWNGYQG